MRIKSFGYSDVGKRREKNEDSMLVNDEMYLYAVADGMGGHQGGDFASQLTTETVNETVKALEEDPDTTLQEGGSIKTGDFQSYLRYAIKLSSRRVFDFAHGNPALRGMGTTVVALLFRKNKAYVANVGDSRGYRIRDNEIAQITKDHSLVGEQIRAGILTEEEARGHRLKNIITRSVGFQEDVEADIDIRVVKEGDRFLLCSDGLSNLMHDNEIRDVVATSSPESAVRKLIDIANERGGEDNITVILAEVEKLDDDDTEESVSDDSTVEI